MRKKEEKGKIREKTKNRERKKKGKEKKQRELVLQAYTNRLFPFLPLKILPSAKSKERGSSKH